LRIFRLLSNNILLILKRFETDTGRSDAFDYFKHIPSIHSAQSRYSNRSDVFQTYCEQSKRRNTLLTYAPVSVIGCCNPDQMPFSLEMGAIVSDAIGCSGDLAVKCPANEEEFSHLWQFLDFAVLIHKYGKGDRG